MRSLIYDIDFAELERFKKLHFKVMEDMCSILADYLEPTYQMIRNLIAIEDAYINVNNPDFILARDATLNIFKRRNDPPQDHAQMFSRPEPNHNIFQEAPSEDSGQMQEKEETKELPPAEKDISEKLKESPLQNFENAGYDVQSNMRTKISNVILPEVPHHMRVVEQPGS